ncbi:MAG: DUF58 domain-containing protein [Acidobacteriota bacterium]
MDRARRARSDGLRLTRVGLGFLVALGVVVIAAVNTGNNGLYLVAATMAAVMIVCQVAASRNVRGVDVELDASGELFAKSPARLRASVRHLGGFLPRRLLVLSVDAGEVEASAPVRRAAPPLLVPRLDLDATLEGTVEMMPRRRGRWKLRHVHVRSLFPFGLFRKGVRLPVDVELLVYPEVFGPSASHAARAGRWGDEATRRRGAGHELHALRDYRPGDDPRAIHWKQTARHRRLILQEREVEESRRLMIVFDNAVGTLDSAADEERFERLVSEAATTALDYLDAGYEVALVTRSARLDYSAGRVQRRAVLELLALVESEPVTSAPLLERDPPSAHLRLAMDVAMDRTTAARPTGLVA